MKTEDATVDGAQVVHATETANGDCSTAADLWGSEVGGATVAREPPVDAVAPHGGAEQGSERGAAGEGSARAEAAAEAERQEAEASARAAEEAAEEEAARVAAEEEAARTAAARASTPIELARDLGLADDQLLFLMPSPDKPSSRPPTEPPSSPQLSLTLTQTSPQNAEEAEAPGTQVTQEHGSEGEEDANDREGVGHVAAPSTLEVWFEMSRYSDRLHVYTQPDGEPCGSLRMEDLDRVAMAAVGQGATPENDEVIAALPSPVRHPGCICFVLGFLRVRCVRFGRRGGSLSSARGVGGCYSCALPAENVRRRWNSPRSGARAPPSKGERCCRLAAWKGGQPLYPM